MDSMTIKCAIIILKATSFDKIYNNFFKNIKPKKSFLIIFSKISDYSSGL
jgi:hypothetical protein